VRDPLLGTQWFVRLDGQLIVNLTAVRASPEYDDAALQADDSRQVGGRLVLNADSDAPDYLFENAPSAHRSRGPLPDAFRRAAPGSSWSLAFRCPRRQRRSPGWAACRQLAG
jgi:hypothetical protein